MQSEAKMGWNYILHWMSQKHMESFGGVVRLAQPYFGNAPSFHCQDFAVEAPHWTNWCIWRHWIRAVVSWVSIPFLYMYFGKALVVSQHVHWHLSQAILMAMDINIQMKPWWIFWKLGKIYPGICKQTRESLPIPLTHPQGYWYSNPQRHNWTDVYQIISHW